MRNFRLTKTGCAPEHIEQITLTNMLRVEFPDLLWTASAGGMRTSIGTAIKMKKMGYSKGTPDIMIFEPRGKFKGLFIELKTKLGGVVSAEQKQWLEKLNGRGYKAVVCNGCDEAGVLVRDYLNE